jgi:hypothetical protein
MFFLILNRSFWAIGSALGIPSIEAIGGDIEALEGNYTSQAESFEGGDRFNTALIFGDFTKGLSTFANLATGGYVVDSVTRLGIFDDGSGGTQPFIFMFQVILGFMGVISLAYLVSGRM